VSGPDLATTLRDLDRIRLVAILDSLLLLPLLYGMAAGRDDLSPIFGPIHGLGFILLLMLTLKGGGEERWDWWFAVITFIPFASLVGEVVVRRQVLARQQPV
jgi:integral membrane protein